MPRGKAVLNGVLAVLAVLYPVLVYLGLSRFSLPVVGIAVLLFAAGRLLLAGPQGRREGALVAAGSGVLGVLVLAGGDATPLLYHPVLVNLGMLLLFAATLWSPPSFVERLARRRAGALPPAAVVYTRRVTMVWCGFFVLNGAVALATALHGDLALWTLYNGLIAYGLMGALFAAEFLVRHRMRERLA